MNYQQRILEYIKENQPCTRKEIIKEFFMVTPKTVYLNVDKLLTNKKIYQDENRFLSTLEFDIPVWKVPQFLRDFQNYTMISNAYARQNKEFLIMCRALSQKYPEQSAMLLCDLIVIANIIREDMEDLAKRFKKTTKVDVHELTNNFKLLEELISQYHKPNYEIENS